MKWRLTFPRGTRRIWLLSLLVLLGRNADWTTERVWLVDSGARSLLAPPEMWVAPCSSWPVLVEAGHWPWWLYAMVMSGFTVRLLRGVVSLDSINAAILTVAVSLLVQPRDFALLVCLVLLVRTLGQRSSQLRPARDGLAAILLAGLAGLLTIEAGLLVGVLFVVLLDRLASSRLASWLSGEVPGEVPEANQRIHDSDWPAIVVLGLFTATVGVACWAAPGLGKALLRPISWIWLRPPVDLFPAMDSSLRTVWLAGPLGAVAGGLGLMWIGRSRQPEAGILRSLASLSAVALGACCGYYAGAAAVVGVALCSKQSADRADSVDPPKTGARHGFGVRAAWCVWLTLVVVAGGRLIERTDRTFLMTGAEPMRRVDPTDWKTEGSVVLLNLNDASAWRTPEVSTQYTLVIDDRWDAVGDRYDEYRAVCRDLREARLNNYLRSDGLWGGYRDEVDEWSAVLLAVDSSELTAIRRLTLSMDWRVMGIDAERTIFGQEQNPANRGQLGIAQRKLLNLEWPQGLVDPTLSGTIEVHTDEDRNRVAEVLCAMRLPYAALRLTRNLSGKPDAMTRATCFLELAHRVQRHSGQASVLDQTRAVHWSRRALADKGTTALERTRLEQGLKALGLVALGADGRSAIRLESERLGSEPLGGSSEPDADRKRDTADEVFRKSFVAGHREDSSRLTAGVSEPLRDLFGIVGDAGDQAPGEICRQLEAFLDRSESAPPAVRAEAAFYLGCSAIEDGDSRLALQSLTRSLNLAPGFRFRSICRVYVRQLSR